MVVRRRKKVRKQRGSRTYGWGSQKKHRGKGSKGGKGKAGMHKHKWTYTVKYEPEHFGKRGFKRPIKNVVKAINLGEIEKLVSKNPDVVKKENGSQIIDLTKLGYEKVLGKGKISKPYVIIAKKFSEKAKQKIEVVGGKVIES